MCSKQQKNILFGIFPTANCQELASHIWTYLNNHSDETIFGSNKIKEQHETMKLQNEEVMLS